MKREIDDWIYLYGFKTGFLLIIAPILWDILWIGARGIFHWSIGGKGMIVQIIGIWLMFNGGRDAR